MKQKTQLIAGMRGLGTRWPAVLCLFAMSVTLAAPVADAADPIVPGIRPAPRALPPLKIPPRPAPGVIPKRIPPGGIGLGPGIVRPTFRGANCRASCGSQCQMVTCSGLNVSQCASIRQQCRMACISRC